MLMDIRVKRYYDPIGNGGFKDVIYDMMMFLIDIKLWYYLHIKIPLIEQYSKFMSALYKSRYYLNHPEMWVMDEYNAKIVSIKGWKDKSVKVKPRYLCILDGDK